MLNSTVLRNTKNLKKFLVNCDYSKLINYLELNKIYIKKILKMLNMTDIDNLYEKIEELKIEKLYDTRKKIILNFESG